MGACADNADCILGHDIFFFPAGEILSVKFVTVNYTILRKVVAKLHFVCQFHCMPPEHANYIENMFLEQ
jgi:hypothetical protein